jgi:hypothetical protein
VQENYKQILDLRLTKQTGTRELPTYLKSEANLQTGARELTTDLRSEVNQQTGTRELTADFRSEAVNSLVPVC